MKQEVIQDFLTVPGIAGIALIDGLSRPYFHGFGASFDLQQEAIAQGIQQVLETTPEGFNSFEFQFDFYRIYLHKLKQGITLLVLTGNTLPQSVYTQAVRRVLLELQLDQEDPIAAFQAIAAQFPLVWQPVLQSKSAQSLSKPNPPTLPSAGTESMQVLPVSQPAPTPVPPPIIFPRERIRPVDSQPGDSQPIDLKDVLAAINALSQITTQYLGTLVVANYWKVTRPAIDWLNYFQIERSTQMTFSVQNPSQPLPSLTPEQHKWLQEWVAAFIERCSKVIRDFAKIVRQGLTEQQRAVLFRPPRSVG
jgi:hypothetical protein